MGTGTGTGTGTGAGYDADMNPDGVVLVTGASGYIAGFTIQQLHQAGWRVRGTVRDLGKADAVRATLGLSAEALPLVAADLGGDAGWAEACAGARYVLHLASPLGSSKPKHEDELIVPARDGALRVLRAAKAAGVTRVVMTSSTAAICYGMERGRRVFTEADWTDVHHRDSYAYIKSKAVAERAARDWRDAEGGALELCTINPGAVIGPVLGRDFSASLEIVRKLLAGKVPGLPRFGFPLVDVRDIADAHVRAMVTPGLDRERFLCAGPFHWMADIAEILRRELGDDARRVPRRRLPDALVKVASWFDPEVRQVITELGKERVCDCRHAKDVLGWEPRPTVGSLVDCARSLIAAGLV